MIMIQDATNARAPTAAEADPARSNARPMTKPKRPLSAFNLFYRFKRQKMVGALAKAEASGVAMDKDAIYGLITAPPGLEEVPDSATESPETLHPLQRKNILSDLEGNCEPRDTAARSHRRNRDALNGAMSFVELGKIMNSSWKSCDPYARSVFDELADEGRERYRLVKKAFNAQSQSRSAEESAKAKATPAPAAKNKSAKETLPTKKYIAAEVKSAPSGPSSKAGNAGAMNETAEAMVQLAAGAPSKEGNDANASVAKEENVAAATRPSLPPLSPREDVGNASNKAAPSEVARAAPIVAPQEIPTPSQVPRNDPNELLKLRVRELESQLEEERLRARIRELEAERSRRLLAREGVLRSALDNVMTQDRARDQAAFAPSSGLQGVLLRHGMQQRESAERAATLARISALLSEHHPSPVAPGIDSSRILVGLDGRPNKRQRVDASFAARRC